MGFKARSQIPSVGQWNDGKDETCLFSETGLKVGKR